MYLVITERKIHHEGDEYSRQHPGHGYPAWTETVEKVDYCGNIAAVESVIKGLKEGNYRVYEATELAIQKSVKFNFIPK